jgi:hypothetical protein
MREMHVKRVSDGSHFPHLLVPVLDKEGSKNDTCRSKDAKTIMGVSYDINR